MSKYDLDTRGSHFGLDRSLTPYHINTLHRVLEVSVLVVQLE